MRFATTGIFIVLIQLVGWVFANPPSESGIISHVTVSPHIARAGETVLVGWHTKHGAPVYDLDIYVGHSTGMGHAPVYKVGS